MAENDGREQAAAAIFAQVATAKAIAALAAAALEIAGSIQKARHLPVSDRCRGLAEISSRVALRHRVSDAPSGAPLTVIFAGERMPGAEDGPVRLRRRGHRDAVTA